jgi:uncharacterized protein (DUF1697 family)
MAATHVALLRGINVGRAKRISMDALRRLMADLGHRDVRTLLNSGNVVFSAASTTPTAIAARIETGLVERLGVPARVQVLTAAAFAIVVAENALAHQAANPSRLMVAFCSDTRRLKEVGALGRQAWAPEAFSVGRFAAYLWCPSGILGSPLMDAAGRVLGDATTVRNWATVTKIQAAMEAGPAPPVRRRSRRSPEA